MTFQEQFDPRELIDPTLAYIVRLDRVEDRETRVGDALQWTFAVHNRGDGVAVLKPDGKQLIVSRITSPSTGPRGRTRRFIHALLGRSLTTDELRQLIQQRSLAGTLKDRQALCFFEFDDRDDATFLRINELLPVDAGKPGKPALEPPPTAPRSYEDVFDDEPPNDPPSSDASPDKKPPRPKKPPPKSDSGLPF